MLLLLVGYRYDFGKLLRGDIPIFFPKKFFPKNHFILYYGLCSNDISSMKVFQLYIHCEKLYTVLFMLLNTDLINKNGSKGHDIVIQN